jgi:SAM-dependent methyltransferase
MTNWTFNQTVAERFQEEAFNHIPSYHEVLDLSLTIANAYFNKDSNIIDVGSALGYTVKKFIDDGFVNTIGVEQSKDMISKSHYTDKIIHSKNFPNDKFDLVLANWTIHFIKDKKDYISDVYSKLEKNGILILTDKTIQNNITKELYYKFKVSRGVDPTYIIEKEKMLRDAMFLESADWYIKTLSEIGFIETNIIHANLGFVTFLCKK